MKVLPGLFLSPFLVKNRYATLRKLRNHKLPEDYVCLYLEGERLAVQRFSEVEKDPFQEAYLVIGLAEDEEAGKALGVSVISDMVRSIGEISFEKYLRRYGSEA